MSHTEERFDRRVGRWLQASEELRRKAPTLQTIWRTGSQPAVIRLRDTAIRSRHERAAPMRSSPYSQLLSPRGSALTLHLLAIFDAHCVPPHRIFNPRPISMTEPELKQDVTWRDLLVLDEQYSSPYRRIIRTFTTLQSQRLLIHTFEATRKARRGFQLLREDGCPDGKQARYTIPRVSQGVTIPLDFFLNGWVCALTPSETLLWLIIRDQVKEQRTPRVTLPLALLANTYSATPAVFDSYRFLELLGLVSVHRADRFEHLEFSLTDYGLSQPVWERSATQGVLFDSSSSDYSGMERAARVRREREECKVRSVKQVVVRLRDAEPLSSAAATVAKAEGVNPATLRRWVLDAQRDEVLRRHEELDRLRDANQRLDQEVRWLREQNRSYEARLLARREQGGITRAET